MSGGRTWGFVLVIAGDEADGRAVLEILDGSGLEGEVIREDAGVLQAIERRPPDLILLHALPGHTDLLERLRASPVQRAIPVIVLASRAGDEDVLAGYQLGADYFIARPYTPRQLLHGIGLVLGRNLAD